MVRQEQEQDEALDEVRETAVARLAPMTATTCSPRCRISFFFIIRPSLCWGNAFPLLSFILMKENHIHVDIQ